MAHLSSALFREGPLGGVENLWASEFGVFSVKLVSASI